MGTERDGVRGRVQSALIGFLRLQRRRLTEIDEALIPVADAIDALVLGGGKRLRPAFGYWGYRGAGGSNGDDVVTALAALEFLQASALIHDDVMDASDTRRGEPSVHRRFEASHRAGDWIGVPETFGRNAAILAGDLCLAWSDEMLHASGVDPTALARAREVFDRMRTEMIVGQYLDVLATTSDDMSVERAGKIATYKSAKYTVERPLLMGAALAGAAGPVTEAYSTYGLAIGEAFQLRDDVLGVFGDPDETGKPAGDDLREGKRTFLIATAFALADPADTAIMRADLGDLRLDADRVDRFRGIIATSGALERTEKRIEMLTEQALAAIATAPLAGDAREALTELAEASVRRRH
ncbi:MAG TPA: polyprenyl synthetase family protein [Micromonosporaceae bacterium]